MYKVTSQGGANGKESTCQRRRHKSWVQGRKVPWNMKRQPALGFLPGECHEQRSLAGCSPWGCKVGMDGAHTLTTRQ